MITESTEPQAGPANTAGGEEKRGHCASGGAGGGHSCLCAGSGPAVSGVVSQLLRDFGPSEPVRKHFMAARLEILKGLRAILDQRISDIQKQPARGVKVTID